MTVLNKEILLAEDMCIPIEYSSGTCRDAVLEKIEKYINLLKKNNVSSDIVDRVKEFLKNIDTMYSEYYLGHQTLAHDAFMSSIKSLVGNNLVTADLPKESFYRARVNSNNTDFKNEEMFHIKYELRGKVATQRFSFPGLPCLYLGASSYVCWLEINRPAIEQFQVALIKQKDSKIYRVIDLSIHPRNLYKNLDKEDYQGELLSYLTWWPMVAMCSVVVKNEKDPFKPEYIFPQYLLQYLLEGCADDDIIGIRYMSIQAGKISVEQYEEDYRTYTNYVFPITGHECNEKGFCPVLSKRFEIIKNYSGKELQILSDAIRRSYVVKYSETVDKIPNSLEDAQLYSTNSSPFPYSKTVFRRIETILNQKDNSPFYSNDIILNVIK